MVLLRKRHLISEIKCCLRYNKLSCDLCCCCSVPKSCLTLCNPTDLMQVQHAKLPCPSPSPVVCPSSCPMNWWCHPTISSSVVPPAINLSQHQDLFQWVGSSCQVAKVLKLQLQHQSFQWTFKDTNSKTKISFISFWVFCSITYLSPFLPYVQTN